MNAQEEIIKTPTWQLYERGVQYNRLMNLYADTDRNYRMVYGNQWEGLQSGSIEPISYNILQPIVEYKVGTINANLWAINYSSENFDNQEFLPTATKACENLNKHASRIWENDDMDYKIWLLSTDACVNGEGIIYVNFDLNTKEVKNEIIDKTDVCYGNENNPDIQSQPYIIIKTRRPVEYVRELAIDNDVPKEKIELILPDNMTSEEAGDAAKYEVNDMVTLVTKLYKKNGTVYYTKSTQTVTIMEDVDSGLTLYPLEHFNWKNIKGSARGVGVVKYIIPNQLEINKTAMRRALAVKQLAYPQKVINTDKISNPSDVDKIGVTLKAKGMDVDDVRKVVNTTVPAQMSSDAEKLQVELITNTRELNNAGDIATGQINPEEASGRAILAVQQASQQPLKEQIAGLKRCIEGLARIWLDIWKTYSKEDKTVIEEITTTDPVTGETTREERPVTIPKTVLEALKANAKVDITPIGAFDRYASEMSIENLFMNKAVTFEEYVSLLPYGSVMPKVKLEEIIKKRKKAQLEIAQIQTQASTLQSQFNQVLNTSDEITELSNSMPTMAEQSV